MNTMNYAFMCATPPPSNGLKAAVVGSGPAGLSAAGWLACAGYEVHVYDKLPKAGGLLVFGIPGFRIPARRIEDAALKLSEDYGVQFHFCTKVCTQDKVCESGDEFVQEMVSLSELLHECAAVLICTGSWRSRKLNIHGEHLPGVYTSLEFLFPLRACKLSQSQVVAPPVEGRRVAVVGAGLSAVDVVQSCLRLGAQKVYLLYRKTMNEAPAGRLEIKLLRQRGVQWMERVTPLRIEGAENVQKLIYRQDEELPSPESGRYQEEERELTVDLVVAAIGEVPTNPFPRELRLEDISKKGEGWLQMTKFDGVFVAGDVLTGPSKIGRAILSGLRAAESLDGWIKAHAGQAEAASEEEVHG
ncbi:glutamate synthase (NADPH/NADH) small chain [Desulfonatronum thiosulfatophilum]|uniref:Glutamate synthase (NADPH/NADH) small chain n=1 Tax=Desulfonatronum thiosulfatophilum TaxID=617002 RepID=A0A1G6B7N6_9BACT|nr:FAD-dependent oxidoreductase [Desulfonatronum thiosulfatophilum]SDB16579.1 glutamate synthase (NADPH/NADH) small chain [Desulfonatronum thiosulfatophilum]